MIAGRTAQLQLEVSEGAVAECRAGLGWKGAGPGGGGSSLLSSFYKQNGESWSLGYQHSLCADLKKRLRQKLI